MTRIHPYFILSFVVLQACSGSSGPTVATRSGEGLETTSTGGVAPTRTSGTTSASASTSATSSSTSSATSSSTTTTSTASTTGGQGGSSASSTTTGGQPTAPPPSHTWTGTWAVSPQEGSATLNGQTVRQIAYVSIGGPTVRIQLSNLFNTQPITLSNVHIAQSLGNGAIDPNSDALITFSGNSQITLAAGGSATSDGVNFALAPLSSVAVTFYVPDAVQVTAVHSVGSQINYIANGNVSDASDLSSASQFDSYYLLTNLDVQNESAAGAVVALGASITDGVASANNTNQRWPNDLARILANANDTIGVLNQGISGNRLLADGTGPSALSRFSRDALGQPNVKWIIFSDDPINDLGNGTPSGAQLIAGLQTLIGQAHQQNLKFLCSTLTPFQGAGYWTPQGEAGRQAVNAYIRGVNSGCDGVIDQDTATHDPANPNAYLPAYDSGDHLHPNDAGRQAIANAIDLSLFK